MPPKLTFSQRLLAALPSLQREQPGGIRPSGDAGTTRSEAAVRPDAVIGGGGAKAPDNGTGTRLRDAFLKPPSDATAPRTDPYKDMSVPDLRNAMKHLDDRERVFPLFIGPLLAALDVALTIVTLHSNPAVGHKGHVAPSSILALGIGSAAVAMIVTVAAFFRRRSFTIFALLFAGYGGGFVTMIPSWFVAGWLFIRFNRMQRSLVAKTGGPAAARQRAARNRTGGASRPLFGRKDKSPSPTGPAANKRYTPPRPVAGPQTRAK